MCPFKVVALVMQQPGNQYVDAYCGSSCPLSVRGKGGDWVCSFKVLAEAALHKEA
jgi:hypothetical protein